MPNAYRVRRRSLATRLIQWGKELLIVLALLWPYIVIAYF